ncbi:MAG: choice-of-anchor L domain-containing protein, partial [Coleofasciculus sp. S288]|nr:choice-of-anchor L domain-containing protein [Coleofasciculus sp. S288]
MRLFSKITTAVAVATTTAFSLFTSPEATVAFSITPNNNGSDLLNTLLGNATGLSNFKITTTGDPAAFGLFSDDPFGLGSGIVLSTGRVEQLPGENTEDIDLDMEGNEPSTDFGEPSEEDDLINLTIEFDADATADKLSFQYVFGSEEFLEFVDSMYNDSFELLLNGVNLAKLSDGQPVTIKNLAPS